MFLLGFLEQKDSILKERLFGLSGNEGNHGEDVKEYYYYLDSTPTHSYMKMLYKYPIDEFPYTEIVAQNSKRTKKDPEIELVDTGIFDKDNYFDIYLEYAKADREDVLLQAEIFNRCDKEAEISIVPTFWYRNTWRLEYESSKPNMKLVSPNEIISEV